MTYLPPRTPTFEAALRDADARRPEARLHACGPLGDPPPGREEAAREALVRLCADPVGPVRALALESLGRVGGPAAVRLALEAFDDPDSNVRQHAVIAAGRLGQVEAVRAALRHDRPEMRFQAASAMAALRPEEAADEVVPLLDDPDPEVREAAVEALGEAGDSRAADALADRLDDESAAVKVAAALALAELGDHRGVAVLTESLPRPDLAIPAAEALGHLGATEAGPALRDLARRWWISPLVRAAAAGALARLGDPLGEQTLRKVLRAFRRDGRDYAARLLAELSPSQPSGG